MRMCGIESLIQKIFMKKLLTGSTDILAEYGTTLVHNKASVKTYECIVFRTSY